MNNNVFFFFLVRTSFKISFDLCIENRITFYMSYSALNDESKNIHESYKSF